MMPATLLALAASLPLARKPWQALAWGLALGLALADYEATLLALPAMALLWMDLPGDERPALPPLLAGLGLGTLIVAIETLPMIHTYWGQRSREMTARHSGLWLSLSQNLGQILFGGGSEDYLLGRLATWPVWLMPWTLLGLRLCWPRQRWVLLLIVCGLAPMLLHADRTETNRALAAWPGLLLATGAGFACSLEWLQARAGRPALLLALTLALAAGVVQMRSYHEEAARLDYDHYEYSRRLDLARQFLEERQGPQGIKVLSGLNYRDLGDLRYFLRGLRQGETPELWVALFDEQLPAGPRPAWGEWHAFRASPEGRAFLLLKPLPGMASTFEQAQQEAQETIGPFIHVVERARDTKAYLLSKRPKNPLAANVILDTYLWTGDALGWKDPDWPAVLERARPQTTRQQLWFAKVWEPRDPAKALYWLDQAARQDPSRISVQQTRAYFFARHPSLVPKGHP
jgi:hypothetical protein